MRVIKDNKGLEGVNRGYEGLQGGHKRIEEVTEGYSWLKGATTGGYWVSGNNRLFLFILELFSFILHFIYKTFNFLIFLFYWKQSLKIDKILISQL